MPDKSSKQLTEDIALQRLICASSHYPLFRIRHENDDGLIFDEERFNHAATDARLLGDLRSSSIGPSRSLLKAKPSGVRITTSNSYGERLIDMQCLDAHSTAGCSGRVMKIAFVQSLTTVCVCVLCKINKVSCATNERQHKSINSICT